MKSSLLVEDDEIIGEEIKKFLEKNNFRVKLIDNYKEACEETNKDYSLVILDINLPDGKGINLLGNYIKIRSNKINKIN
ncbi:response regulator [Peptoniphilus sp. MSJ-1]|uniref:Response regulator n=1 Tax=Peptoniphilus ovalis TaxID=2841503 RepID=A0ABS6FGM1_9FIRM|nr:response regulator [Peptoniphilus ovalis]MBU5668608.1 response regulator [Peptoniphilus ovalis]